MSRVYDTPRYEDQVLNKILLHVDVYSSTQGDDNALIKRTIRSYFANPRAEKKTPQDYMYYMGLCEQLEGNVDIEKVQDELTESEVYLRYIALSSIQRPGSEAHMATVASGCALLHILQYVTHSAKRIYCDSDATHRITEGYLSGKYSGEVPPRVLQMNNRASVIAKDLCAVSMTSCRLGQNAVNVVKTQVTDLNSASPEWLRMYAWWHGTEKLRMSSMNQTIADAHDSLRTGFWIKLPAMFEVLGKRIVSSLGCLSVHRIIGLYVIEYSDAVYILDYSSLDQMHSVSKMWEGFFNYAHNYRLSGGARQERVKFLKAVKDATEWVAAALRGTDFSTWLARSMKQSVALLQNELHSKDEVLNVHWERKSASMRKSISDILLMESYWHDFVSSTNLSHRAQLDLANIYYGLPSPDCNVQLLFGRATTYMSQAHKVDEKIFPEFLAYSKTVDLIKCLQRFGKNVSMETAPGYEISEKHWYKEIILGKNAFPPREELGKAWVKGFFPFNDTLPTWYWEAGDVTRVEANLGVYNDLITHNSVSNTSHNELLYALEKAPLFSHDIKPEDVYVMMCNGTDRWDRVAEMAAKNENTKPEDKVREIWSADDITRELTSCYDRCSIPLSSLYPGVTARKSDIAVQSLFNRICALTRPGSKERAIIMSNDVSGWSPQGDRDAWARHHDYVIATTKCPEILKIAYIWRGITAAISKRGFIATHFLEKGLFQGWTGGADSKFNVNLSAFSVRMGKWEGYLEDSEGAIIAGLIDDAVQAVKLNLEADPVRAQIAADRHFDTTCRVWKAAGAEIDEVKTMYSSIKFIYLNRLFCQGSEVLMPMKVYARADREYNRRFASIHAQFDTVWGAFNSASFKGACPMYCYFSAMKRCVELAIMTNGAVSKAGMFSIVNAAFAPRGLGGWGFPHIVGWLTQESKDELSRYTAIMTSLCDSLTRREDARAISALVTSTLEQGLKRVRAFSILQAPFSVVAESAPNPQADLLAKIKKGMIDKCKSKVFKDALLRCTSESMDQSLRQVMSATVFDATVLEILGQCMPETCSSALVDRAYKNELITQLFPYRIRTYLLKTMRSGSYQAVGHLLSIKPALRSPTLTREDAFTLASELRTKFYEVNGVNIVNHTLADYASSLARLSDASSGSIVMSYQPLVGSCPGEGSDYCNLYDGMLKDEKQKPTRSSSAFTFSGERFVTLTPVQRCINKAAVLSAHVSRSGGNGRLLWELVMLCWGAPRDTLAPAVSCEIKLGTSLKRLSSSRSHVTHPIACFTNTQGIVNIDAIPLGRYLNNASTQVDFMSYVTSARCIALLELSAHQRPETMMRHRLVYGFLSDGLPLTDSTSCDIMNIGIVESCLEQMEHFKDDSMAQGVLSAMVDITFGDAEGENYTSVTYLQPSLASTRSGTEFEPAPGYLSMVLSSGVRMPGTTRHTTAAHILSGDELLSSSIKKADTRYRKYRNLSGSSQSVLVLMIETMRDLCKGAGNMEVLTSRWNQIPEVFASCYPDWRNMWENVRKMAGRFVMHVDEGIARTFLGTVNYECLSNFCSLSQGTDTHARLYASYLYCAAYGLLRESESYRLTSLLGPVYMSRVWGLSAKRRHKQANEMSGKYKKTRILASYIYRSASNSARNFRTRLGTLESLQEACESFYAKEVSQHSARGQAGTSTQSEDYTEMEDPYKPLLLEEDLMNTYEAMRKILYPVQGIMNLIDAKYLKKELSYIIEDIQVLGLVSKVEEETGWDVIDRRALDSAETMRLEELLPASAYAELFSAPEEEDEQPEQNPEGSDLLLDAAYAYTMWGIAAAADIYYGIDVSPRDQDPSQDEIDDFLLELQEFEADQTDNAHNRMDEL